MTRSGMRIIERDKEWRPHEPCLENTVAGVVERLKSAGETQATMLRRFRESVIRGIRADLIIIDDPVGRSPAQARNTEAE